MKQRTKSTPTPPPSKPPPRAETAAALGISERTLLRRHAHERAAIALAIEELDDKLLRLAARYVLTANRCNCLALLSSGESERRRLRETAVSLCDRIKIEAPSKAELTEARAVLARAAAEDAAS